MVFDTIINSVKNRFQSAYDNVTNRDGIEDIRAENLSCRDIMYSARKLEGMAKSMTTKAGVNDEKVLLIRRIGLASWLGGRAAEQLADEKLIIFINIFRAPAEPLDVKIEAIKTISSICCLNSKIQTKILINGFLGDMLEVIAVDLPPCIELQKWIIYCLICLCADNATIQKELLKYPYLQSVLSRFQTESWFSWKRNEAKELMDILAFGRR